MTLGKIAVSFFTRFKAPFLNFSSWSRPLDAFFPGGVGVLSLTYRTSGEGPPKGNFICPSGKEQEALRVSPNIFQIKFSGRPSVSLRHSSSPLFWLPCGNIRSPFPASISFFSAYVGEFGFCVRWGKDPRRTRREGGAGGKKKLLRSLALLVNPFPSSSLLPFLLP